MPPKESARRGICSDNFEVFNCGQRRLDRGPLARWVLALSLLCVAAAPAAAARSFEAEGSDTGAGLGARYVALGGTGVASGDDVQRLAPVIDSARALGDWRRLSHSLNVRGNAHSGLRQWAEAVEDYRECIRIAWRGMSNYDLVYGLWNLPRALLHLRRPEQGVPLFAFANEHWRTHFGALNEQDRFELRRARRLATRQLPPRQVEALWRQGAALTLAEAVSLALA